MAGNEASLLVVEGNCLLYATTMASLAIFLSIAGVTEIPKMPGPKVRIVDTKAIDIKAVVVTMVMVLGRPVVRSMPWIPMSSRGI